MRLLTLFLTVLCGLSFVLPPAALAGPDDPLEIGGPAGESEDGTPAFKLSALAPELDLGLTYTWFTGPDMEATYTGLPQVNLGLSLALAPHMRTWLAVRYGSVDGDPYYDLPLMSEAKALTLRSVPLLLGLKFNVAQNTRLRFWLSAAWMLAWVEEENQPEGWSHSGLTNGFLLTVGPEIVLEKGHRVGLELGWGGTRGTLDTQAYNNHEVDLVGFHSRLYYAFAWTGGSS